MLLGFIKTRESKIGTHTRIVIIILACCGPTDVERQTAGSKNFSILMYCYALIWRQLFGLKHRNTTHTQHSQFLCMTTYTFYILNIRIRYVPCHVYIYYTIHYLYVMRKKNRTRYTNTRCLTEVNIMSSSSVDDVCMLNSGIGYVIYIYIHMHATHMRSNNH